MSSSYDISTAYDALNENIYDLFDLDAYCSSLSSPVSPPEPIFNPTVTTPHSKRHSKTRGHPRPSPAIISPPSVTSTSSFPVTVSAKPNKGKVISVQPQPYPPPVLWTPRPPSPPTQSNSPQNSTSALCRCLNVLTSGSHRGGNQGSTSRVYRLWLKSSTPQNP